MSSSTVCPNLPDLHRFLLGQGADEEAEIIESHLGCCPDCLEAVRELDPCDDLVEAARAQATLVSRAAQTVRVDHLIRQLKELYPATTSCTAPTEDYSCYFTPPQTDDEIGRIGSYRVRRLLGMGGMGVVFLAEDTQLQREVALKLMRPTLVGNLQARQRFLREAQAAAAVVDDHVVPIYQVGEDRNVPFLAMPLLQGESLADRLAREGRLPLAEVIHVGTEIALGLAAAHKRGLVHRDVKPANVWLEPVPGPSPRDRARLLDFGLAQVASNPMQLTEVGTFMGTPAYVAPEQARGEAVDARCDLFSLGSILYAMATGRPPFAGENNLAILHSLCEGSPMPVQQLVPEVPEGLAALIEKLHAKDRADRCQTAQEVVEWLEGCRRGEKYRPRVKAHSSLRRRWLVAALVLLTIATLAVVSAAYVPGLNRLVTQALLGLPESPMIPPSVKPKDGAEDKPAQQVAALAVLAFDERGTGAKDLGAQVTDLLFAKLAARDNLLLVDRAELEKVLKELELGLSGAVKEDSRARVGQLTGARLLLWGTVIQVDKRRYLVAKLVSAETGQVLGVSVDAPATDELGPLVGKLADKVSETLAEKADKLLPKEIARVDRLAALQKQLGKGAKPTLWVRVTERAVTTPKVPDPAAQTELVKVAKEVGFTVVDNDEGAKGSAAVLLTGEGMSEVGGRRGDLVTVKARVEVKAVDRASGKVVAVDSQVAVVVDVTEQLAGKAALEKAAAEIAVRLLPKLVSKE